MMNEVFVLVTSSFPIRGDGSEAAGSFVADIAEELAKRVKVHVVAPGAQAQREVWSDRIQIYRYAAPSQPLSTLRLWRPRDLRWTVRVLNGGLQATRDAAEMGAAHIFALWGLPCGEWARRVAGERNVNYSVWMLGSDVWSLGRVPGLRGSLARVIRKATHAYADGYLLAEEAQRISGIPVEFLPSTRRIDMINFPPPRSEPPYRLLFLGRWHANKGIDLLLDALELLDETDWRRIECVEIQGGGPLERMVRERGSSLKARGRPVLVGDFLKKHDAEAAIVRADWLLIPSRIESIPVIFSDAMKLRRPVVSTPVGDLPKLVRRGCGLLSAAATPQDFATALRTMLQGGELYDPFRIRISAEAFSLTAIADRILMVKGNEGRRVCG
jgi:glycosyltransferase involved in cell wall biosynthesis